MFHRHLNPSPPFPFQILVLLHRPIFPNKYTNFHFLYDDDDGEFRKPFVFLLCLQSIRKTNENEISFSPSRFVFGVNFLGESLNPRNVFWIRAEKVQTKEVDSFLIRHSTNLRSLLKVTFCNSSEFDFGSLISFSIFDSL
jgi:hypothetical protein